VAVPDGLVATSATPPRTPPRSRVKEVMEETGIEAQPIRLTLSSTACDSSSRNPLVFIVVLLSAVGGEINTHPLDASTPGGSLRDNLPSPIIAAERWPIDLPAIDGETSRVFYDDHTFAGGRGPVELPVRDRESK